MTQRIPTVGVFDSGVGGLTVLKSLLTQASAADYLYLGDTARLPYGSKSRATVARYAVSSARFLVEQGAEALVIACNTASALALDALRSAVEVPVIGVIETGATAALQSSETKDVLVIATAATVESHAYSAGCRERGLRAIEKACPLLVPLVEEGWIDHKVTEEVARIYLDEAFRDGFQAADVLLLGCTHYPLIKPLLQRVAPAHVTIVDSAESTAGVVAKQLAQSGELAAGTPELKFFATDSVEKFRRLGARFLGQPIEEVQHVQLSE